MSQYTKEEFGQMIKAKYPQYQGISDAELADKIIVKYPQYQTVIKEAQVVEENPKEEKNNKIQDFAIGVAKGVGSTIKGAASLGEKTFGKVVGAEKIGTPREKGKTSADVLVPESKLKPTNTMQKIGFAGEQIAEFLIPGGAAAKIGKAAEGAVAASKLKRLAKIGGTSIAEGGIATGHTAIQRGELDKSALSAGVFSGAVATPAAFAINKFAQKAPTSLWSQVLRRTQKSIEKNPNLEKQIADVGLVGSRRLIRNKAQQNIQVLEMELDDLIETSKGNIDSKAVAGYLDEIQDSYKNIPGEQASVDTIEAIKKETIAKGILTPKDALGLKREIYKKISESYGKGLMEVPAKKDAQKAIARGLKEEIEKLIPEAKTISEKQAIFIQTKKALDRALNQPKSGIAGTGIGMYDLLLGGVGAGIGGLETAAKLVAVKKIAESATLRTSASRLLNYFDKLSPTKKILFYNGLNGIISNLQSKTKEKK